jgi:hypothetical protein
MWTSNFHSGLYGRSKFYELSRQAVGAKTA